MIRDANIPRQRRQSPAALGALRGSRRLRGVLRAARVHRRILDGAIRNGSAETRFKLRSLRRRRGPSAWSTFVLRTAWLKLAMNLHEYPNSAAFVTASWRNRYALFLCESDPATVACLNRWARTARQLPGCEGVEVAEGDWRKYLRGHLLPSLLRFTSGEAQIRPDR